MHLRSRTVLESSATSRTPTKGNNTQSNDHLESLKENPSMDSQSKSILMGSSERNLGSADMFASTLRKGNVQDNLFDDPIKGLDFNITLTYHTSSVFGADIYKDPLGRFVFNTAEHQTPFQEFPEVNYQGDLYIGKDGAHYQVTRYPQQIDSHGVLQAGPIELNDHETGAHTSTKYTDPIKIQQTPLEKLSANFHFDEGDLSPRWKLVSNITIVKLF